MWAQLRDLTRISKAQGSCMVFGLCLFFFVFFQLWQLSSNKIFPNSIQTFLEDKQVNTSCSGWSVLEQSGSPSHTILTLNHLRRSRTTQVENHAPRPIIHHVPGPAMFAWGTHQGPSPAEIAHAHFSWVEVRSISLYGQDGVSTLGAKNSTSNDPSSTWKHFQKSVAPIRPPFFRFIFEQFHRSFACTV